MLPTGSQRGGCGKSWHRPGGVGYMYPTSAIFNLHSGHQRGYIGPGSVSRRAAKIAQARGLISAIAA